MKTYKFEVIVNSKNNSNNILDNIIQDVNNEKEQLKLTHSINIETSKIHKEILKDFCEELNTKLSKIGLGNFGDIKQGLFGRSTTKYECSVARLIGGINHEGVVLSIEGVSNRDFKDSKYLTYTGDFKIFIIDNDSEYYTANQLHKNKTEVKTTDDVIKAMEFSIKEYLHKRKI